MVVKIFVTGANHKLPKISEKIKSKQQVVFKNVLEVKYNLTNMPKHPSPSISQQQMTKRSAQLVQTNV